MQNDRVVSTPRSSSDPSAVPVWTTATGRFCITFTPGQVRMAWNLMDLDLNELTMDKLILSAVYDEWTAC